VCCISSFCMSSYLQFFHLTVHFYVQLSAVYLSVCFVESTNTKMRRY